jgi:hypothetical protein
MFSNEKLQVNAKALISVACLGYGWDEGYFLRSADIRVRLFVKVNTEADKNVRAPKKMSCAHIGCPAECGLHYLVSFGTMKTGCAKKRPEAGRSMVKPIFPATLMCKAQSISKKTGSCAPAPPTTSWSRDVCFIGGTADFNLQA